MAEPPDTPDAPVIVIGAAGGIGRALARRLAASGRRLHLIARDPSALDVPGATRAAADVLDHAALRAAVAEAGPRASGLAYCVGSITLKPLKRATEADFLDAYRLNVIGAAMAVAAAQDALRAVPGSSVVLFSSIAARAGFASHAVIGAAKAGVEGLMLALAAELAPAVRVNAVAPSLTRTKIAEGMTSNEAMARAIAAQHPIPRLGEPDDAAAAAAFLLSADSGWITGQVLAADGGRSSVRTKG